MLLDFKKAFLDADIERDLYVELPDDDERRAGGANVGKLNKAMYGTRDAPAEWSRLVKSMMVELNFVPLITSACVYMNRERGIRIVSHVDDFLCSGPIAQLQWLRRTLKEKYEVDGDVLGWMPGECKEGKFLGRIIRYSDRGIEVEADPKQVKGLISEYGLEEAAGVGAWGER